MATDEKPWPPELAQPSAPSAFMTPLPPRGRAVRTGAEPVSFTKASPGPHTAPSS